MGGLERRQYAFQPAAFGQALKRLAIVCSHVADPADRLQQRVFGAYARVVQTGGNRRGFQHLAVVVVQEHGIAAVQDAGPACGQRGCVLSGVEALAARFHPINANFLVAEKGVEQADGIGPAADAGE